MVLQRKITIFIIIFIVMLAFGMCGFCFLKKDCEIIPKFIVNGRQKEKSVKQTDDTADKNKFSNKRVENTKLEDNNQIYILAKEKKDINLCERISKISEKELCIKLLAAYLEDKKACDKIKTFQLKQECMDTVDYNIAVKNKDLNFCLKIDSRRQKDFCISKIVSLNNYTEEECLALASRPRDICLSKIFFDKANMENNAAICQKIPLEGGKDECFYEIFSKYESVDLCEQYFDGLKDNCLKITVKNIEAKSLRKRK